MNNALPYMCCSSTPLVNYFVALGARKAWRFGRSSFNAQLSVAFTNTTDTTHYS